MIRSVFSRVYSWLTFLFLSSAHAETIQLRPVADTALLEAFPSHNFGGQRWLNSGTTQNYTKNRGLLRFDIAGALPRGSRVLSASMNVEVVGQPIDGYAIENFRLHRLLKDWGEGNKTGNPPSLGAPAGANECNWTHRFAFTPETWSEPGASNGVDYATTHSVETYVYDTLGSPYTFGPAAGMSADLQQWLDHPETNFGWMLIPEHEEINFTARRFASREDPNLAPLLTIDYIPPTILSISLSNGVITLQFMGEADQAYTIEHCHQPTCTSWQVLTNLPPEPVRSIRIATDTSSLPQRYYRVKLE